MKNIYKIIGLSLFFCGAIMSMKAQVQPCGTDDITKKLRIQYPQLVQEFNDYNQSMSGSANANRSADVTYIIPVVFHIIHVNGPENISDAQVFAQVNRMNEDYRKMNSDTSAIVSRFDTLAADVKIEFRLAQLDPNGNCTNGIERIYSHKSIQADNNSKLNQWPREKYLNIWVVHDIAGSTSTSTILGYAQFPSDVNGPLFPYDGIVAVYSSVNGSSRTLTHEVGHWLNLQHTWGSTNEPNVACGDDLVDDTPYTKGHFSTCPLLDAPCTTNPFTANFKFDNVTTTSGNIDTTHNLPIVAVTSTGFSAVGVSANSSGNGALQFSNWGTGAPNGATSYASLTGSINTSKYYQVKFTPQYGYNMKYTTINFRFSRNATGVRTFAVRSSRDNFTANIGTASVPAADAANMSVQTGNIFFLKNDTTLSVNSAKIGLVGSLYINDTMPVTFRFYGWNAEDSTGTFNLDSVNFIGSSDMIENVQNYMDYSSCTMMFTKGQALRMRTALESPVADRNNLWSDANLAATGVLSPQTCVSKADFFSNKNRVCAGDIVKFTKNTQVGTADSVRWTFYGGTPFTSNSMTPVNVTYANPGIYKVTLTTYNAAGTDSLTKTDYIRVDPTWADIDYNGGFYETFEDPSRFYGIWSINNYDNNKTWTRFTSAGYQSNTCMKMEGFGNYQYDMDDLYTPSYDFSFTSGNIMTFRVAAASHGGSAAEVNDVLKVYASKNCGTTWSLLATYSDSTLINNGYYPTAFTPTPSSNWSLKTINLASTYNVGNVRFRFEYETGAESNNIYLDNLNINGVVGIDENSNAASSLAIYPNPANESSTIAYHLNKKSNTKVEVVDVLGKTVFVQSNSGQAEGDYTVLISKQALSLKNGIYFVKFSVEDRSTTKKLIITQ
ncbi:MAG: hypothetical protein K0Q95_99 [Bacteroidota bacterium]|jgi:PKD repeat protein|nr:hypothetical protein [Bacteroidota bacterium]